MIEMKVLERLRAANLVPHLKFLASPFLEVEHGVYRLVLVTLLGIAGSRAGLNSCQVLHRLTLC